MLVWYVFWRNMLICRTLGKDCKELRQALVSVGTATYRQEDALKRGLFSLGEQTFRTSYPNVLLQQITNPENLGSAKGWNVGVVWCWPLPICTVRNTASFLCMDLKRFSLPPSVVSN